jgi:DNA-binding GntR family transcriptional regulator
LASQAYHALRQALMTGYMRPGERVTMRALAEELGMSVTPVRDAIQLLIIEHALVMPGPKTVMVPRLDVPQYHEIVLIRCALEKLAAEQAMSRLGADTIAELRRINALHREAIEKRNVTEFLKYNKQFHFLIYRGCAMSSLVDLIENQWVRIGPTLSFLYPRYSRSLSGNQIHERMIDAIEAGDTAALRRAVEADMMSAQRELSDVLSSAA